MGGGDLNLKKSWHPHTMKNQERVWKAEQEKKHEEAKLLDLKKEIEEEKSREELRRHGETSGVLSKKDDKKMDWMYKNSTALINRDEYLLGRTIDKSFETLQAEEQEANLVGLQKSINHVEHECIPFSIRYYKDANTSEQVDLPRKRMEDPLQLIREKEMESRRKLLDNPVRLKELHRLLNQDTELKKLAKQKKSKKSKKSKKKKKKKSKSDSSDSDSVEDAASDLDSRLKQKYEKLKSLENKEGSAVDVGIAKLVESKFETITRQLDHIVQKNKKARRNSSSCSVSSGEHNRNRNGNKRTERGMKERRRSRSPQRYSERRMDERRRSRSPQHDRRYGDRGERRLEQRQRSRSPRRHDKRREYSNRDNQRDRRRSRSNSRDHSRRRSRSRSGSKDRPRRRSISKPRNPFQQAATRKRDSPPPRQVAAGPAKLTEEEKEARRREMMQNAAWREADRTQAVQKHRDAYAREEEQHNGREFDKDFLNKQVKKAISNQTSVGSRLRANLNNIQRTASAMDANFARK